MATGRHAAHAGARVRPLTATTAVAVRAVSTALVALLFVGLATAVVGKFVLHLGMSPVLTGSMRPAFAPGDAVVTRVVPVSSVRPGTVAVFVPPGETTAFAHRVVTVSRTTAGVVVTTKGDANPQPDRWHAVLRGPRVSVVVAHVPKLGYALVAVHQRRWRATLIALIGLLATGFATRSVVVRTPPVRRGARHAHA